jgi:hypothetical protein
VAGRLDEEKLAQLRAWAETLLDDDREELRAAARGLLLMADEIERLRLDGRSAFGAGVGSALSQRLGASPSERETDEEPDRAERGSAGVA